MNKQWRLVGPLAVAFALQAASISAQQRPAPERQANSLQQSIDPGIARVIAATKAIDNHAHPVLPPPDDTRDRDFDALPVDSMELTPWRG